MSRTASTSADHWTIASALGIASPYDFTIGGWTNTTAGQNRRYACLSVDVNNTFAWGQDVQAGPSGKINANSCHGGTNSQYITSAAITASTWQHSSASWKGTSPSITAAARLAGGNKGSGGSITAPTGTLANFNVSGRPGDFTSGIGGGVAHVYVLGHAITDLEDAYMAGGGTPRAIGGAHFWYMNTASGTEADRIGSSDLTITGTSSFASNPNISSWWTAAAQGDQSATQGSTFPAIDLTTKFEQLNGAVDYTCTLKQVGSAGSATTAVGSAASASRELTVASASGIVAGSWVSIAGGAKNFVLYVSGNTLLLQTAQTWSDTNSVTPYAASTPTGLTTNGYTITAGVTGGTVGAGAVGTYSNCYYLATNNTNSAAIAPSALHTITVAASGAAPSFSAGPTLTTANTDGYTYGATCNQTATWHLGVYVKGSATPSVANVKAGTGTGFVLHVTAALTAATPGSLSATTLTLPIYDVYHVVSNGSGDSALSSSLAVLKAPPAGKQYTTLALKTISAITKANPAAVTATAYGRSTGDWVEISFVAGMTEINGAFTTITKIDADHFTMDGIDSTGYTTYTSGGILTWGQSSLYGASVTPATGDIGVCDAVDPQGAAVTLRDDGVTVYSTSSLARQSVTVDFYDVSAGAMVGTATDYMNDQPPIAPAPTNRLPPIIIPTALTFSGNLAALLGVTDPQGDTLVASAITSLPTGFSVSTPNLTGITSTESQTAVTFQFANASGESVQTQANLIIGNLTVPNLVGQDSGSAQAVADLAYFVSGDPALQDDPNPAGPAAFGIILAQTPAAGTKAAPGTVITLSASSGNAPPVVAVTGVVDVLSSQLTQGQQPLDPLSPSYLSGATSWESADVCTLGANDQPGSLYRFFKVPSNARIVLLEALNDANPSGSSYAIGIRQPLAKGGTLPVTPRRVTIQASSVLCANFSLDSERTRWESVYVPTVVGSVPNKSHYLRRVWELLGLTQDPNQIYEVVVTALNPGTIGGNLALRMAYVR